MSYGAIVRSLSHMHFDDPKFDVEANEQQEVLMTTPSCVAAVDVLINSQAVSTQAQCSAITHFAVCPLLDVLLLHQLRLCARWPSSLPGQALPSFNVCALSYKGTQTYFMTG